MRSKRVIYNIISSLFLQFVTILYGLIVPRIIISSFGSNVNGLVSSITQFLAYITLLESGFGPVVKALLYKPISKKDKNTIAKILKSSEKFFRRVALIFIIYIVALFFIYPLIIDNSFDSFYTISLIAIIGISTFAEYYFGMTYRLFLQAKQKTYVISIIQIVTYVLSVAVIMIVVSLGAGIHIVKLASGLVFILRPILQNMYVKRKYGINLKTADSSYKIKQKWDGLAQHIAYVIHTNTDITVLTIFTSLSEVSVYSVYYLIIKGVKALMQAFTSSIDAVFGDMIAKNETDNLNKKFGVYEVIYNSIITIAFSCTIVLIVPFVAVYTKGITDADYVRPLFGVLITISELIWAIRQPYNDLVKAAGHFKETRRGAWVECISNIVISVALVNKFGIVGVAIGTIVAMLLRTIEFVYHANKYILRRSVWESTKKLLLVVVEVVVIVLICNCFTPLEMTSYLSWGLNALAVFGISIICVFGADFLFFRKELGSAFKPIKKVIKRKNKMKPRNM